MEEEKEVGTHKENDSSEVSPPDTSKGSKVQEEDGQENQDNLEGDGNDDAGSEVYRKDSKEVSIPETLIASQGEDKNKGGCNSDSSEESKRDISKVSPSKVKVKAGGTQKDSSKVSTCDNLKLSQSKGCAKGGKQTAKHHFLSDSS
eukprot:7429855-Ditylum_brightwellii.AAC.1